MNNRFKTLDLVKFIAAIGIVIEHILQIFPYSKSLIDLWVGEVYFGNLVELFFILSGIVMGISVHKNRKTSFGTFFAKRYLRVFTNKLQFVFVVFIILWGALSNCFINQKLSVKMKPLISMIEKKNEAQTMV